MIDPEVKAYIDSRMDEMFTRLQAFVIELDKMHKRERKLFQDEIDEINNDLADTYLNIAAALMENDDNNY